MILRRVPADAWIALVLIAACGFVLNDLTAAEGTGAFVKTTTLPIALVVALAFLALLLLVGAVLRPAASPAASAAGDGGEGGRGLGRVAFMIVWIAAYVAAMPWLGYMASTAAFLVGAGLAFGNRNPVSVVLIAIAVPVALYLFFEKFMIILLPASRLLG